MPTGATPARATTAPGKPADVQPHPTALCADPHRSGQVKDRAAGRGPCRLVAGATRCPRDAARRSHPGAAVARGHCQHRPGADAFHHAPAARRNRVGRAPDRVAGFRRRTGGRSTHAEIGLAIAPVISAAATGVFPLIGSYLDLSLWLWGGNCDMFAALEAKKIYQPFSLLWRLFMKMKMKLTVAAAIAAVAGIASAQDMVVKIGHVGPMSGAQAHYGKDNENGVRMAIEDLNAQGV